MPRQLRGVGKGHLGRVCAYCHSKIDKTISSNQAVSDVGILAMTGVLQVVQEPIHKKWLAKCERDQDQSWKYGH